ncbi:hypothetical protein FOCC_FOCC009182 [Frankliniella occidentalis]|nr:hypothetical protein FOCC_FOCC009182 [Frankliniella occidentalis]
MICKKGPFHSFPKGEKNQERRLKWMQNSGNEDLLSLSLASLDSKFVCGGHFSSDSYSNKQISRLKANALPTENLLDVFTDEVMLGVLGHDECLRNVNVVSASSGCSVSCSSRVESNYVSLITPNDDVIGVVRKNIWRSCCFVGCESDGSHRVLHQFPKLYCNGQVDMVNVEKLRAWAEASGNEALLNVPSSELCKKYFACSSHFNSNCYFNNSKESKKLRVDARPTDNIVSKLSSEQMLKFPVWDSNIIDIDVVDENVVNDGAVNRCVSVNYFDPYQKKFEDHMRGGVWLTCDNCNEKFLHRGRRKKKCIHTPDVCNSLSRENNMDPGEMPDILKGLSYVEEQLIARIHPVVSLYKIKGQQMAYSGNVINFPQNVKAFAKVLPHKVSDLANIITVRTSNAMTPKEFHVRGSKVLEALKWLQKNNKYYQDIEISLENVSSLPVDGNVYDAITSMQSSSMDEEEAGIEFESDDKCIRLA